MAEASAGASVSEPSTASKSSGFYSEDRQSRTEATSRSQNDSRRHETGFDKQFSGKQKQINRGKGTESSHVNKGRYKPRQQRDVEPFTTTVIEGSRKKEGVQILKKSSLAPSGGNESDRRFSGNIQRKHERMEEPGNAHNSGSQSERNWRNDEKSRSDDQYQEKERFIEGVSSHSKKRSKGYPVTSRPIQDSNHGLTATHNKKPFVSHGTVSGGVYIRKDNSTYRQPSAGKKQLTSNNMAVDQNIFEKRTRDLVPPNKTPDHSPFGKKSVQNMPCVSRVPASQQVRKFEKGSRSSMQASMLIEQLTAEKYECMVCCEVIRCSKAVWCCCSCYHIFHLFCIKRWARSPAALVEDGEGKTSGWRCPACQFVERNVPNVYRCFCGKVEEPKWYPQDGITPHSCGELCLKKRIGKDCPHPCNQLCHPGPCPSCPVTITKRCCCGKTTSPVRCGNSDNVTCSSICGKTLNCGNHTCQEDCHLGPCEICSLMQEQSCYCGKSKTEASCGSGSPTHINGKPGYFSCAALCSMKLDCGNHECDQICHPSECHDCMFQPNMVTHCFCGKEKIVDLLNGSNRNSCLDPIPTCGNSCDRLLPCAKYNDMTKASSEHRCKKLCHTGDCSSCQGDSIIKCRCRATSKKLSCADLILTVRAGESYLCELKCNKKLHCGRHRCNKKCCPGTEHTCNLTCGKRLKCGKHKCMEPCHSGTCPPCLMAGFDEVFCPCGATVQEPPIPCGKPPPMCHRLCARMHPCQHEVDHNCHYEEYCPQCTVLVSKRCMGDHKLRHNIPCHVDSVSCGEECGKSLPCGKHRCPKMCHKGSCFEEGEQCKQPCVAPRQSCGHPCDAPCHEGQCPKTACKKKIRVYCKCGRKSDDAVCLRGGDKMEATQAYQRFTTKNLAEKIKGLQEGQTVDISGLMNLDEKKSQLDCDEDCAVEQRNRVVAEALGISQPDFTSRSDPAQFPHFLEELGRANMKFVYFIEDVFDNLVKNVAKVQSPKLSHSFSPMNNKNRRFVHELATCYGCSSVSYDQEPNRNTVVTATKQSRCPRVKLSSHIQRQINPQPPPPVPVLPDQGIGNVKFIPRKSLNMDVIDYFEDDF